MQDLDIEIDLDPRNQAGYAALRIAGAGAAESQGVHGLAFRVVRLDREKDNQLGVDGWSPAETDLLSEAVWSEPNGDLTLRVGPRVVDHISYDTNVEIAFAALEGVGYVTWPDLPTSNTRGDAGPQSDAAKRQAAADAERKRAEQAEAARRQKAEEEEALAEAKAAELEKACEASQKPKTAPTPQTDNTSEAESDPRPTPGKPQGRVALAAVAAVVVLLGGLGAAYFMGVLDMDPGAPTESEDGTGATVGISPTDDPMGYVRQFVDANPQAPAQYERAVALIEQGAIDAAFVLMTEAALQDHGAANFRIARAYDPTVSDSAVKFEATKDAGSALRYYDRAIADDHEPAQSALTRLIDHLKERAAAGERQAQRLLDGRS